MQNLGIEILDDHIQDLIDKQSLFFSILYLNSVKNFIQTTPYVSITNN